MGTTAQKLPSWNPAVAVRNQRPREAGGNAYDLHHTQT